MPGVNVACPSGLVVEVRGLKTREADILADRSTSQQGILFTNLLRECCLGLIDPGPYQFENGKVDWLKVLQGDRMFALLQVRVATYGPLYLFALNCENDVCGERFEWQINLEKDLVVKPLPEESKVAVNGGTLTTEVRGRKYTFRLPNGHAEIDGQKTLRNKRAHLMTAALEMRIVEVDGVPPASRSRFLEDLDMGETTELIAALDEADCGVETDIEVRCPQCRQIQDVRLPFGREFFLPKARRK